MMNQQEIKDALHANVCRVTFVKVNGDERVMDCTLKTDFLPPQTVIKETTTPRKVNEDALAVYDVNADGWRSFRWDSIKNFEIVNDTVEQ